MKGEYLLELWRLKVGKDKSDLRALKGFSRPERVRYTAGESRLVAGHGRMVESDTREDKIWKGEGTASSPLGSPVGSPAQW